MIVEPHIRKGSGGAWARRKNGEFERLKGCDATMIDVGEAIIIQTPTAGGCGAPET